MDVGCCKTADEDPIPRLVKRFHPDRLIGFDPYPLLAEREYELDGTTVFTNQAAAWLYDGEVMYTEAGSGSHIGEGPHLVECFDFAAWLARVLEDPLDVVVKFDCEGSEYALLRALRARNLDARLKLILVEWHPGPDWDTRYELAESLRCPVEEWYDYG